MERLLACFNEKYRKSLASLFAGMNTKSATGDLTANLVTFPKLSLVTKPLPVGRSYTIVASEESEDFLPKRLAKMATIVQRLCFIRIEYACKARTSVLHRARASVMELSKRWVVNSNQH
jgi:hypothetical protein